MRSTAHLGSVPGLARLERLLERLGHPERRTRFIHVAGTNGKGSVCAMLSSLLTQAGYRTGLFTSPFLSDVREQVRVDGRRIDREAFARLARRIESCGSPPDELPTEFELMTALAFLYFAEQACDIVVLETGLGGGLDATNVIPPPLMAVITPIGLDHTQFLGGTLADIAAHKAGILKSGSRAVLAPQAPGAQAVLESACRQAGVPYSGPDLSTLQCLDRSLAGQHFVYAGQGPYTLPLLGAHQLENAALALEVVRCLQDQGLAVPEAAVQRGLACMHWPARMEVLSRAPLFLLDGGHNLEGVESAATTLAALLPGRRFVFLFGVLRDKPYPDMIARLAPLCERFVAVQPDNPRALPLDALCRALAKAGRPVTRCQTVTQGVQAAMSLAGKDGAVCALGSLYMAGEIRTAVLGGQGAAR